MYVLSFILGLLALQPAPLLGFHQGLEVSFSLQLLLLFLGGFRFPLLMFFLKLKVYSQSLIYRGSRFKPALMALVVVECPLPGFVSVDAVEVLLLRLRSLEIWTRVSALRVASEHLTVSLTQCFLWLGVAWVPDL